MMLAYLTRPPRPMQWALSLLAIALLILAITLAIWIGPKKLFSSLQGFMLTPVTHDTHPSVGATLSVKDISMDRRASEIETSLKRNWSDSLIAIEQVDTKDVTVLEFHPDYTNATFIIRGEARRFDALSNFVRTLNKTGLVRHVRLTHENGVSREHLDTIEFELKGEL